MSLDLRRAFAAIVCLGVLGAQLATIIPPEGLVPRRPRFWPFTNYPMYAAARHAGDVFRVHELRAYPCGGGDPVVLDHTDVRMPKFNFWDLLEQAADPRRAAAEKAPDPAGDANLILLTRLIATQVPGSYCVAEVREKGYLMGADGWNPAHDIPWRTMRTWSLGRP
jgi:hypothetical protein